MSEAEIIESAFIMGSGAVSVFAVYVSVLFAYLAAAYLVGSALTRFQALVVSCLFLMAETIASSTCVAAIYSWEKLIAEKPSFLNTIPFFTLGTVHIAMAVMLVSGVLVALYFMHNVRTKGHNSVDASAA